MDDILAALKAEGFEAEVIEDRSDEFQNFSGAYECTVENFEHKIGESKRTGKPFDFYALKAKVVKTVEGEKAENRTLDITWQNHKEGLGKMLSAVKTGGLKLDITTTDSMDTSLVVNIDKPVLVRAWEFKGKEGNQVWVKKIVNKFKLKEKKEPLPSSIKSDSPVAY